MPASRTFSSRSLVGRAVAVGVSEQRRPFLGGVGDQFVQIPAHHRVAAGKDQDRVVAKIGNPVNQAQGFFGGEFVRVGVMHRVGPAVDAGIGAGAGHFPGDGKGRQVEIGMDHVLVVQAALGSGARVSEVMF
jgi:hypothetical protein